MLHCIFKIGNPWGWDNFKNLYCKSGMVTKHKAWEFEIIKHGKNLLTMELSVTTERDHAGINLELGLVGYIASLRLYDTRHWDSECCTWEEEWLP